MMCSLLLFLLLVSSIKAITSLFQSDPTTAFVAQARGVVTKVWQVIIQLCCCCLVVVVVAVVVIVIVVVVVVI